MQLTYELANLLATRICLKASKDCNNVVKVDRYPQQAIADVVSITLTFAISPAPALAVSAWPRQIFDRNGL